MHLKHPIRELLLQLLDVLQQLSDRQYTTPIHLLSEATIGQHIRHIIEFFQELDHGYEHGRVNYDRRKRNHMLEVDRSLAMRLLEDTAFVVDKPDKDVLLVAELSATNAEQAVLQTNYFRELLYNIETMGHP